LSFKHGRLGEIWLNGVDVSPFFASADVGSKLATADVSTFKASWKAYLAGLAESTLSAAGYYDSADADKVRDTLQAAVGQATYFPAGAVAIGDQGRLLNINTSDVKYGSKIGGAVTMDWTAMSTAPVGLGNCLATLAVYGVGVNVALTGEPSGLGNGGVQTTTGLVAHLHVTAMTGGDTHTFKLQDATTVGGAYTDIASGAFVNVTAVGSQRLVVPGTIRQFVRLMYTVAGHSATFGVAAART
jgi:hypothetical protein